MTVKFENELNLMDALIRSGKGDQARKELSKVINEKVPREGLLPLARISRRLNLPNTAIKLLNPLARGTAKMEANATGSELAEYAANLTFIGASREALTILKAVDSKANPEVLLFQSFAHFAQWNYEDPIPLLERYLQTKSLSEYEQVVGKVNLAAALVHEKQDRAVEVLADLLRATQGERYQLLRGNALELAAQAALYRREWKEAQSHLKEAGDLVEHTQGLEKVFALKWESILRVLRDGINKETVRSVLEVRSLALKRQLWETVRDCDRVLAIQGKDITLFHHVYFGTPFERYKKKLIDEMGLQATLPQKYAWHLPYKNEGTKVVDLTSGLDLDGKRSVETGSLLYRLLWALSRDFYQPHRLAEIHFQLYPDDFFNPLTSPARVHEAVKRLRQTLAEGGLSLEVRQVAGNYQLTSREPIALLVGDEKAMPNKPSRELELLKKAFGTEPFRTRDAGSLLDISRRSSLRLLTEAEKDGKVVKVGRGTSVRYRFAG